MTPSRILLAFAALGACVLSQKLSFTAIQQPQFVPAAQASFIRPGDLLLGVSAGSVAKAYPAAIVAQHGLVADHMPDGPIAVTW